jgi:hypothetical protein
MTVITVSSSARPFSDVPYTLLWISSCSIPAIAALPKWKNADTCHEQATSKFAIITGDDKFAGLESKSI